MGYEIFLAGQDDGDLGSQAAILPYLERLPGWTWEDRGVAHFYWPEYGLESEQVVYGAGRDPIRLLTFSRPSEQTMALAFVLAEMFDGQVFDPERDLEDEFAAGRSARDGDGTVGQPTAFDELLWGARVAPLGLETGSGWAQVSAHLLRERERVSLEPASEERIVAVEQQLGVRLPELLREWYLGIGDLGYLPAVEDLRLDGHELVLAASARYDTTTDTVTTDHQAPSSLRDFIRNTALWEF